MPALLKEGFVTQEQVEEERIKKVKAESEVRLADLDINTYLTYAAPKDREQKEADVHNTELESAARRSARRRARRRSGPTSSATKSEMGTSGRASTRRRRCSRR